MSRKMGLVQNVALPATILMRQAAVKLSNGSPRS